MDDDVVCDVGDCIVDHRSFWGMMMDEMVKTNTKTNSMTITYNRTMELPEGNITTVTTMRYKGGALVSLPLSRDYDQDLGKVIEHDEEARKILVWLQDNLHRGTYDALSGMLRQQHDKG